MFHGLPGNNFTKFCNTILSHVTQIQYTLFFVFEETTACFGEKSDETNRDAMCLDEGVGIPPNGRR